MKEHQKSTFSQTTFSQKAGKTCDPPREGVSPSAPEAPRSSKRECATARATMQERREPQRRRQACSALASQQPDLAPGLCPGQQTHESLGFVRPTPTDFDPQDDKPRSGTGAHQLGVTDLFRSPGRQAARATHLRQQLVFLRNHRLGGC